VYDYPFSQIENKVRNSSLRFQSLGNREMKAARCCVFGRSHNDFVASVFINESATEKFVLIMEN